MHLLPETLLESPGSRIELPAGSGKTWLIAEATRLFGAATPTIRTLVLTHTHAGVRVLTNRLQERGAERSSYWVRTLDGWALELVSSFPGRSAVADPERAAQSNDWEAIHDGAMRLLQSRHIRRSIELTFGRALVDEYQDCSLSQHRMILALREIIPTYVFRDPMQSIFGFRKDDGLGWDLAVKDFPNLEAQTDEVPHRWKDSPELGRWIARSRNLLAADETIDLSQAPSAVNWVDSSDYRTSSNVVRALTRDRTNRSVVVLQRVREQSYEFARWNPPFQAIETAENEALVGLAARITNAASDMKAAGSILAEFAAITSNTPNWVRTVQRQLDTDEPMSSFRGGKSAKTLWEVAAMVRRDQAITIDHLLAALDRTLREQECRLIRPDIWRGLRRAVRVVTADQTFNVSEAVRLIVERERRAGRDEGPRFLASTPLLTKGLEYDAVVLMRPDAMSRFELYVALSRGMRSITIVSNSPMLAGASR